MSDTTVFDLDALAYGDTYKHTVKHPKTGADSGLIITIAGPGHPAVIAAEEAERLREQERTEKRQDELIEAAKAGRTLPPVRETVAESRARNSAFVAARIVSSTPLMYDGKEITLSAENAEKVLSDPKFGWLFDDIFAGLMNRANFINNSAKI